MYELIHDQYKLESITHPVGKGLRTLRVKTAMLSPYSQMNRGTALLCIYRYARLHCHVCNPWGHASRNMIKPNEQDKYYLNYVA